MSNQKKIETINRATLQGVTSLAVRPNMPATYGVGGLSATQLQQYFDNLSNKAIEKINKIIDTLSSPEISEYLLVKEGFTLNDFFNNVIDENGNILVPKGDTEDPDDKETLDAFVDRVYLLIQDAKKVLDNEDKRNSDLQEGLEKIDDALTEVKDTANSRYAALENYNAETITPVVAKLAQLDTAVTSAYNYKNDAATSASEAAVSALNADKSAKDAANTAGNVQNVINDTWTFVLVDKTNKGNYTLESNTEYLLKSKNYGTTFEISAQIRTRDYDDRVSDIGTITIPFDEWTDSLKFRLCGYDGSDSCFYEIDGVRDAVYVDYADSAVREVYIFINNDPDEYLNDPNYYEVYKIRDDASVEGIRGKSAYEIAVENGFDGTKEEWLESLKGGLSAADVIDELDSDATNKPLSAAKGKELNEKFASYALKNDISQVYRFGGSYKSIEQANNVISFSPVNLGVVINITDAISYNKVSYPAGTNFALKKVENSSDYEWDALGGNQVVIPKNTTGLRKVLQIKGGTDTLDLGSAIQSNFTSGEDFVDPASKDYTSIPERAKYTGTFMVGHPPIKGAAGYCEYYPLTIGTAYTLFGSNSGGTSGGGTGGNVNIDTSNLVDKTTYENFINSSFNPLAERVGNLENNVTSISESVSEQASNINGLMDSVEGFSNNLQVLESTVNNLSNKVNYVAIKITDFSLLHGASKSYARGYTVPTLDFSFSLNKEATEVSITNTTYKATKVSSGTFSYDGSQIKSTTNFTIKATDGETTDSKTITIMIYDEVYAGGYAAEVLPYETANDNIIEAATLKSIFGSPYAITSHEDISLSYDPGTYLYYCAPTSFGKCKFKDIDEGFPFAVSEDSPITMQVKNDYDDNIITPYYVYRSAEINSSVNTLTYNLAIEVEE